MEEEDDGNVVQAGGMQQSQRNPISQQGIVSALWLPPLRIMKVKVKK